jgi:glutathione S-transferase
MLLPNLQLIAHELCPYVQRPIIFLEEKFIPFIRTDIDLSSKPIWFSDLSPMGRVPVLVVDNQKPLFESSIICEYLDEITPGSLHPDDIFLKAQHGSWIELGSSLLQNISCLYDAQTHEVYESALADIRNKCGRVEKEIVHTPFFGGEVFHLIDTVYAPIFRYMDVLDDVLGYKILDNRFPRINHWRKILKQRPSVQRAVNSHYPEKLIIFIKKRNGYLSRLLRKNH